MCLHDTHTCGLTARWVLPLVQVLAARIQGPDSPFAHYIANLPIGISGVPMFFPREALEAIEYPPVVEQVWLTAADPQQPLPGYRNRASWQALGMSCLCSTVVFYHDSLSSSCSPSKGLQHVSTGLSPIAMSNSVAQSAHFQVLCLHGIRGRQDPGPSRVVVHLCTLQCEPSHWNTPQSVTVTPHSVIVTPHSVTG